MADALPNARDCEHGRLARSCHECELEAENELLRALAERMLSLFYRSGGWVRTSWVGYEEYEGWRAVLGARR